MGDESDHRDVLIEPHEEGLRDDVMALLEKLGAAKVKDLGPAFISARVAADVIDELRRLAHVHPKEKHTPH